MADPTFEIAQASGAQTQMIYGKETDWGVSQASGFRKLNVVAGESLDDAITTFQSKVIRDDRMRNPTVRGSHKPGGSLPIEMAPQGISQFLWHLLGGIVITTQGGAADVNQVQTITVTATGGTYRLSFNGKWTAPIAYGANAAAIQAALEAVSTVKVGNVAVAGGGPYTVTFQGDLGATNWPAMSVDNSAATGGTAAVAITTPGEFLGAGKHKHIIRGSKALPTGFTIEKGFLDLAIPMYFAMKGCRVNRFQLNGNVDAIVDATLDILGREMVSSATSVAGNSVVADAPVVSSFTSVQAAIYRNGTKLSVCQTLSLDVQNAINDSNIVLGSQYRQNLKPATRNISGNAQFLFQDTSFYQAAVDGTNLVMAVKLDNGLGDSITFNMPKTQLLPNNSSPKITSDGPLSIPANYEALPDAFLNSDIECVVISDEATIDY